MIFGIYAVSGNQLPQDQGNDKGDEPGGKCQKEFLVGPLAFFPGGFDLVKLFAFR